LIGAEGGRLLENELHMFSCVGKFKVVFRRPAGATGQVRTHRSLGDEEKEKQRPPCSAPTSAGGLADEAVL